MDIKELLKGADVRFESVSGDGEFYFAADVSAKFEVEAHANGKIINKVTSDKVSKAKYGPASSLKFSINGGNANVEMNTISGDSNFILNNIRYWSYALQKAGKDFLLFYLPTAPASR